MKLTAVRDPWKLHGNPTLKTGLSIEEARHLMC